MGTRGDVQPFAVLGKALKKKGHDVTIATARNFESLVNTYDLKFAPVEADFQAILNSEEGKKMMRNPFAARKHLNTLIYPMMKDSFRCFYKQAEENEKVLFHVKAMADHFAEKFPGKLIRANIVPAIEPTKEFVNPIISFLGLPSFCNRFSYKLSEWGMKMMSKPMNEFRKEYGIPGKFKKPHLPSIYGLSSCFLPQPKDYPADSYFTGFWMDESIEELNNDLVAFIHAGSAPLLITFGSMPFESKIDLTAVINRITKELKTRVIVVKGWGLKITGDITNNRDVMIIDSAPYDKLMPHLKAAVHHGGIGTVAACLKAGIPFLICPVLYPLGDQHFWGTVAFEKGLSLKPVPLKKMNNDKLVGAIKTLLSTEHLFTTCRMMAEQLKKEDGIRNAVKVVEGN